MRQLLFDLKVIGGTMLVGVAALILVLGIMLGPFLLSQAFAWWCPGHGGGSFYCTGK